MSGMRLRESVPPERAEDPGAYHRAGASESDRVRDGAPTMQWLRAVVHRGGTSWNRTGEVRRHGIGDDRATPLWKRRALQAAGAAASEPGKPTAGCHRKGTA